MNVRRAFELSFQLRAAGEDATARERLARILTDKSSVEAKALAGLEKDLLEDYFQFSDNENTDALVSFLASFLVTASAGAERLAPETVQAYLAYLRKTNDAGEQGPPFYWSLLKSLVDQKSPADLPPQGRRRVARGRISLAEQYRRAREYETARNFLGVLDDGESGLQDSDKATGWYERAYIEYMEDNYGKAVEYFDRSAALAETADDRVGAAIPSGPRQWAAYFLEPTEETLKQGVEQQLAVLRIFREHELRDARAERWVRNALAHLANLHYYLDDVEGMTPFVLELRNNPWVRDYETTQGGYQKEQHEARYLSARGRFRQSAQAWRSMFRQNQTKRTHQSAAWLMFDYGMAVERSGRKTEAAQIYLDGLNTPKKGSCNEFWHGRIQERLDTFSERVRSKALNTMTAYRSPFWADTDSP